MLFGHSPIRIKVTVYRSSDVFYWKYGLQCELPVVWDTGGDQLE